MRVLLTGAQGQLGKALCRCIPEGIELIATARQADAAVGVLPLDLSDRQACRSAVLDQRPDWVLNAGAYTAVDQAESEPQLAQAVNAAAPTPNKGLNRLICIALIKISNLVTSNPSKPSSENSISIFSGIRDINKSCKSPANILDKQINKIKPNKNNNIMNHLRDSMPITIGIENNNPPQAFLEFVRKIEKKIEKRIIKQIIL